MTIIPIFHDNNTGFIDPEILEPYGPIGWWENIKMGGVGSCKVYYESGIEYFDEIISTKTDLPMVNFEIMHFALLAKLSIERECYTVAIPKSNIYKIYFNESKSLQTGDFRGSYINKLHIFIKPVSTTGMVFEIISGMKGATASFFKKSYFSSLC